MNPEQFYEQYLRDEETEGAEFPMGGNSHNSTGGVQELTVTDKTYKGSSRRGLQMKPQLFDGSDDFETYLDQFECIADLGGWTLRERTLTLGACLKGQARRFYAGLAPHEKREYASLIFQLRQRFGTASRHGVYWTTQFENRKRLPNEGLADFSDELLLLAQRAYPNVGSSTQHQLALQQWYKNMSPDIKWRCLERNCQTIREAEEVADMYEAIMVPQKKKIFMVNGEESTMINSSPETTDRNRQQQKGDRRCWTCNGTTHLSRDCRQRTQFCTCCKRSDHSLKDCNLYRKCKEQEQFETRPTHNGRSQQRREGNENRRF